MPLDSATLVTITLFVLGGLGWLIQREIRKREQRAERRNALLDYTREWRRKVVRSGRFHEIANAFDNDLSDFIALQRPVRRDLSGLKRIRFETVCSKVTSMNGGQVSEINEKRELTGNQKLSEALDGVISFLE